MKDCHCYTCGKNFHHLGIMSHRAMHRRKDEDCRIMYSDGQVFRHNFSSHLTMRAADLAVCPGCGEDGLRIVNTCVGCGYDYSPNR